MEPHLYPKVKAVLFYRCGQLASNHSYDTSISWVRVLVCVGLRRVWILYDLLIFVSALLVVNDALRNLVEVLLGDLGHRLVKGRRSLHVGLRLVTFLHDLLDEGSLAFLTHHLDVLNPVALGEAGCLLRELLAHLIRQRVANALNHAKLLTHYADLRHGLGGRLALT